MFTAWRNLFDSYTGNGEYFCGVTILNTFSKKEIKYGQREMNGMTIHDFFYCLHRVSLSTGQNISCQTKEFYVPGVSKLKPLRCGARLCGSTFFGSI